MDPPKAGSYIIMINKMQNLEDDSICFNRHQNFNFFVIELHASYTSKYHKFSKRTRKEQQKDSLKHGKAIESVVVT